MIRTIAWVMLAATPLAGTAVAEVIGYMTPAPSLDKARVAALPIGQQRTWNVYLDRSREQMRRDRAALAAEQAGLGAHIPAAPPAKSGTMPLDRDAAWYGGAEALAIADNIVSFQTPAGGWGKNQDRSAPPRLKGQSFVVVERLPAMAKGDIQSQDAGWVYVGTIDNGATTTEMRFLARVQRQRGGAAGEAYRAAFLRGVQYLLGAQFPNGGWPQIWPLEGGYHDAITFNDDAMADVIGLLLDLSTRQGDFAFVPVPLAAEAGAAVHRAVDLILRTQIIIDGKPTGWGQQHDALTLAPVGARNFEPVSISSNESAALIALLMRLPERNRQIDAAIDGGVAWLRSTGIRDVAWTSTTPAEGRRLVRRPGAGPVWARFYDIRTMRPIFGDRDRSIHDDVNEISLERRNGYSWYSTGPVRVIAAYDKARGR